MTSGKTISAEQLVRNALNEVETLSAADVVTQLSGDNPPQLVDIRDIRELERVGRIPGAVHAPRGMLEFWFDPESEYHREVFSTNDRFVLFCAAGWRSALAAKTLQDMGFDGIAHMEGGFGAWEQEGHAVDKPEPK